MVAFTFSLWIPFKGNLLLSFGCLAPQKYSDVRITLVRFNFSIKYIKEMDATCFLGVKISPSKPFAIGVSPFSSLTIRWLGLSSAGG